MVECSEVSAREEGLGSEVAGLIEPRGEEGAQERVRGSEREKK